MRVQAEPEQVVPGAEPDPDVMNGDDVLAVLGVEAVAGLDERTQELKIDVQY